MGQANRQSRRAEAEPYCSFREVTTQSIDGDFTSTFLKTVHALPMPSGGALSTVRKRRHPAEAGLRGAVVLVHGFGQNRYTWHSTHRSFVNYLAFRGYDVFNLELRGFGRSLDFGSSLPDHPDVHFEVDLPRAVRSIREISGRDSVFLIGHSLGGACCYAAAPLVAEWVRGVVSVAGLYQFAAVPGLLSALGRVATALPGTRRTSYRALPVQYLGPLFRRAQRLLNSRLFRLFPVQAWYPGTVEGEVLSEINRRSYDRASLGVVLALAWWGRFGRITSRAGEDVLDAFDRLDKPVLFIGGSRDSLIPPTGVKAAFEASRSSDKQLRIYGPDDGGHHWGHVDLILGRDAPAYVWPEVADWLDQRSTLALDSGALRT